MRRKWHNIGVVICKTSAVGIFCCVSVAGWGYWAQSRTWGVATFPKGFNFCVVASVFSLKLKKTKLASSRTEEQSFDGDCSGGTATVVGEFVAHRNSKCTGFLIGRLVKWLRNYRCLEQQK